MTSQAPVGRKAPAGDRPSAVLIIDNPLRDIDGLVMLAWELSRRGWNAFLVPMYDQAFAVEAIKPDLVVANYIRPNNAALLRAYRRGGAAVMIVDTEGAAGQNADDFVRLLARSGLASDVDGYCVWGERQLGGFLASGLLPAEKVRATGCPRYDIASPRWRGALSRPDMKPGYILINTNLAAVSPRFSRGIAAERAALISVGMDPDHVDRRFRDELAAQNGLIGLLRELTESFPDVQFVLRPHPFESDVAYRVLCTSPNFSIRQEGTSLEWLNAAAGLIHLNCSTAIEAAMLGKEALSPKWLDTPALHIDGPAKVSWHMEDAAAMKVAVAAVLSGSGPVADAALLKVRAEVIRETYLAIDGQTNVRIADFAEEVIVQRRPPTGEAPLRFRMVQAARRLLGPRLWLRAKALRDRTLLLNYRNKQFDPNGVNALLERLSNLADEAPPRVTLISSMTASGGVLRISPPDRACSAA
jgi:surface carbohydrate biosynthesis protein